MDTGESMGDDPQLTSTKSLEDLATNNFVCGQPNVHSLADRPPTRDRAIASHRPIVILRRHSLMNERTRIKRSSPIDNEKTSARRLSMRKRKSDDLNGIDLSQLAESSLHDSPELVSTSKHPQMPLVSMGHEIFDMNSSWQHSFRAGMNGPRSREKKEMVEEEDFIDRFGDSSSIFAKEVDPTLRQDNTSIVLNTGSITKILSSPQSASFRNVRYQSSGSNESDSPCSVDVFTRGCGACFWERSLAWSEDDEDDNDSIVHPAKALKNDVIREHLSVPIHLGKEFDQINTVESSRYIDTVRRPFTSRTVTLETGDSRHKLPGSKMFRQTDVDKVTEIHWEEKVVDTTALELMAKLSL
jgi:hypothetical protein